jgi:hypothetical protein
MTVPPVAVLAARTDTLTRLHETVVTEQQEHEIKFKAS